MALKVYKYSSGGMKSGTIQAAAWHFSISAKGVETARGVPRPSTYS